MAPILYYLFIKPISLLPFPLLYALSDAVYLMMYALIGYRKKVVRSNIEKSFPELSQGEHRQIEKAFYKHFCDIILETFKSFSMREKNLLKRFQHLNPELLNELRTRHERCIIVGGHYNNWEWLALGIDQSINFDSVALYTRLSNVYFDNKVRASRGKFGLKMVPTKKFKDTLKDIPNFALILGSDQCPRADQKAYWMTFLNQETGVQFGAEKLAKDYNCPVVYAVIDKLKRGHYQLRFELVTEKPLEEAEGFITQIHTLKLERDIKAAPAFWLWSHKRWKRAKPEEATLNEWDETWGSKP